MISCGDQQNRACYYKRFIILAPQLFKSLHFIPPSDTIRRTLQPQRFQSLHFTQRFESLHIAVPAIRIDVKPRMHALSYIAATAIQIAGGVNCSDWYRCQALHALLCVMCVVFGSIAIACWLYFIAIACRWLPWRPQAIRRRSRCTQISWISARQPSDCSLRGQHGMC